MYTNIGIDDVFRNTIQYKHLPIGIMLYIIYSITDVFIAYEGAFPFNPYYSLNTI